MQYQGTIASIVPDGGYQSQNGWIFRFNMTINSQQGPVTGEIGSKTEFYPLQPGEQIVVDSTNDSHGTKFKKVNPGYNNQQQAPPQQQGYQEQAPPPQQRPQQNNVQDDIRFAQSLNRACEEFNNGKIEENCIDERTNIYYRILQTRVFPMKMTHGQPQPQQQSPPQQQQPQYGSDPALDSEVPF